jgi:hypothetical protein
MVENALYLHLGAFYETLAEEMGIPVPVMDNAMTSYARLSARGSIEALDFELPVPTDNEAQLRAKFAAYLDTRFYALVEEALKAREQLDAPVNPVTAPHVVDLSEKNVSSARRSKTG